MEIIQYVDYFHDGSLNSISHIGSQIDFHINSADLKSEDIISDVLLDERKRLAGVLTLKEVSHIVINDELYTSELKIRGDDGDILDFDIDDHDVLLGVEWCYYGRPSPTEPIADYTYIVLTAEQILWRNDYSDKTIDLTGQVTPIAKRHD